MFVVLITLPSGGENKAAWPCLNWPHCAPSVLSSPRVRLRLCFFGINCFWLFGLVEIFCVLLWKNCAFGSVDPLFIETGFKLGWNIWKSICVIMWHRWSSHKDYSQELQHINQKWLGKCFVEKGQQTFDPNKQDCSIPWIQSSALG